MLGVVPSGAEAELDPSTRHRVDLRDLDGELTRPSERHRRHQGAEADARRLARECTERQPGVGRTREAVAAETEVVVRPEEHVEAQVLCGLRHTQERVVGCALLRLREDAKVHRRKVSGLGSQPPASGLPAGASDDAGMSRTDVAKRRWLWLVIGVPIALVVLVVGGTFVYIHFIEGDPPPRLTFSSDPPSASSDSSSSAAPLVGAVDGAWNATNASVVGYRVKEVLFGQDNEAAGRTNAVTGEASPSRARPSTQPSSPST